MTTSDPWRLVGEVESLGLVSSSMYELVVGLEDVVSFRPGQFCMLNLGGGREMVLSRPFSILAVDGNRVTLLFKAVGSGTRAMATCKPGAPVVFLGPLGQPFPSPDTATAGQTAPRHLLLAGGVGLPPLLAWQRAWGREGDLYLFGGRDGGDVPWSLVSEGWRCSVDRHVDVPRNVDAFVGNVVELAREILGSVDDEPRRVLACGPLALLRAVTAFAGERGWDCRVSVEERMGCGYGVCRGCVVPRADGEGYLTACHDGPVLAADAIDWKCFGRAEGGSPPVSAIGCNRPEQDTKS